MNLRETDYVMNITVIILSVFTGVLAAYLFNQDATLSEKLMYFFIVGVSTWLMLFIFMWTVLWIIRGIRK